MNAIKWVIALLLAIIILLQFQINKCNSEIYDLKDAGMKDYILENEKNSFIIMDQLKVNKLLLENKKSEAKEHEIDWVRWREERDKNSQEGRRKIDEANNKLVVCRRWNLFTLLAIITVIILNILNKNP